MPNWFASGMLPDWPYPCFLAMVLLSIQSQTCCPNPLSPPDAQHFETVTPGSAFAVQPRDIRAISKISHMRNFSARDTEISEDHITHRS